MGIPLRPRTRRVAPPPPPGEPIGLYHLHIPIHRQTQKWWSTLSKIHQETWRYRTSITRSRKSALPSSKWGPNQTEQQQHNFTAAAKTAAQEHLSTRSGWTANNSTHVVLLSAGVNFKMQTVVIISVFSTARPNILRGCAAETDNRSIR